MWFGEPHRSAERGSPTGLSASGQTSKKRSSCRTHYKPLMQYKQEHLTNWTHFIFSTDKSYICNCCLRKIDHQDTALRSYWLVHVCIRATSLTLFNFANRICRHDRMWLLLTGCNVIQPSVVNKCNLLNLACIMITILKFSTINSIYTF